MRRLSRKGIQDLLGFAAACLTGGGILGCVACGGTAASSTSDLVLWGQPQGSDAAPQDSQFGGPSIAPPVADAATPFVPSDDAGGTAAPTDVQSAVDSAAWTMGTSVPKLDASGGAPADAPPIDAGSRAEGGAGVLACSASKYVICEDFESTAVGGIPAGWTGMGQVAVTADDAYASKHSLKFTVPATGTANYRSISTDASKIGSSHWGRVYMRLEAPVPSYFAHDTFVYLTGNGPTKGNEQVRVVDTVMQANHSHQFLYNVQPSGAEFGKGSAYTYSWDAVWHCAEWYIDSSKQSYHFFFDKVEVTQIAIDNGAGNYTNADIPSAFGRLTLAVNQYQSPPAGYNQQPVWITAWLDELAVDVNRVGCN